MATKKKLLQAAAGTAAASGGAGGLNVEQVFSTYLYDGNGSSQVIENDIKLSDAPVDNVYYHSSSTSVTSNKSPVGDFTVSSGGQVSLDSTDTKYASNSYAFDGTDFGYLQLNRAALSSSKPFCFETWVYFNNVGTSSNMAMIASQYQSSGNGRMLFGGQDGDIVVRLNGGTVYLSTTTTVTASTWHHVAWSFDGTTHRLFFNGSLEDSSTSLLDLYTGVNTTFGGNPSSLLSGYNLNGNMEDIRITIGDARYTSSFTVPSAALPTDTADGLGKGGLVWIKGRSGAYAHQLYDTERGVTKMIGSDSTAAEATKTGGVTSFNSSGFSIGNEGVINPIGDNLASWTFRKASKFFDVVTYTGDGTTHRDVPHNLGSTPGWVITKRLDAADNWMVYSKASANEYKLHWLNTTDATVVNYSPSNSSYNWTDTVFYASSQYSFANTNASGASYVSYLFANHDGDGDFGPTGDQDIIKCGSYTGTGSEMFIDLGFEPQWILTRRTDTTDNWFMVDTMRGIVSGGGEDYLWADTSNAEQATTAGWAVNPTGFTVESASRYASGGTYIYIAIRRGPMAVPTDATDVFDAHVATTSSETVNVGFPTDFSIFKGKDFVQEWYATPRLTEGYMQTNATAQEGANPYIEFDAQNQLPTSLSGNYLHLNWKRAPSFFDVVAYTGNGTAGRTVSHGLTVPPEMMWVKRRSTTGAWAVYHKGLNGGTNPEDYFLVLNSSQAETTGSYWNNTAPTDSVITFNGGSVANASGHTYIAYLFASVDGVSKVGSINHTSGVDTNVDCGFQNGARFVLWKQTDAANSWGIVDVERGLVSGNDALLLLNSTAAETSSYDLIDPLSSGFVFTGAFGTGSYIFYAIA